MGTNYDWFPGPLGPCPTCGQLRDDPPIHIGKSSYGWCFALHVTDDLPDWPQWLEMMRSQEGEICDEYGRVITLDQLTAIVTNRSHSRGFELRRSEIDGVHCVGHGEGTWDLIRGDFS